MKRHYTYLNHDKEWVTVEIFFKRSPYSRRILIFGRPCRESVELITLRPRCSKCKRRIITLSSSRISEHTRRCSSDSFELSAKLPITPQNDERVFTSLIPREQEVLEQEPRHRLPSDDDLGSFPYSTSRPKSGFLSGSTSFKSSPGSSYNAWKNRRANIGSPMSYQTARSSLASYTTAPSSLSFTAPREHATTRLPKDGEARPSYKHSGHPIDTTIDKFCIRVIARALYERPLLKISQRELEWRLRNTTSSHVWNSAGTFLPQRERLGREVVQILRLFTGDLKQSNEPEEEISSVWSWVRNEVDTCFTNSSPAVFSSQWLDYLKARGILLDPEHELDWSGRGQHVEYLKHEEDAIPLRLERVLGWSASALVHSVMCRRIRLARKLITCNRRLNKEEAIAEVEHLQRAQHSHVIRVVGTYVIGKTLAILLYPVAHWNLEEFMDSTVESASIQAHDFSLALERSTKLGSLYLFFGCLSQALSFIHSRNIKHMDIKPKNILVRQKNSFGYKVYIADFGIARSYPSADQSITDSPTSFTRTYAPPEVVMQKMRGLSADIFSLGCVFMEMFAVLMTVLDPLARGLRNDLLKIRLTNHMDASYQANIESITSWYVETYQEKWSQLCSETLSEEFFQLLPKMLRGAAEERPTSQEIATSTRDHICSQCFSGPEQFKAADSQ